MTVPADPYAAYSFVLAVNSHLPFSGQNLLEGLAQHVSQEFEGGKKSATQFPWLFWFSSVNEMDVA